MEVKDLIRENSLRVPSGKVYVITNDTITMKTWNGQLTGGEGLYEYIGCRMVEMLLGCNKLCGCDVYFDEEGFTKPVNFLASSLLGKNFRGVVCITKEEEEDDY